MLFSLSANQKRLTIVFLSSAAFQLSVFLIFFKKEANKVNNLALIATLYFLFTIASSVLFYKLYSD